GPTTPPTTQNGGTGPTNNQQDPTNTGPGDQPVTPPNPDKPLPQTNLAPLFQAPQASMERIAVDGKHSYGPAMSDDGRFVVFIASNGLPDADSDPSARAYIYDRETGTLRSLTDHLVGTTLHQGEAIQNIPSITADGHWVVFAGEYQTTGTIGEG